MPNNASQVKAEQANAPTSAPAATPSVGRGSRLSSVLLSDFSSMYGNIPMPRFMNLWGSDDARPNNIAGMPLDSEFISFAQALYAYQNSDGWESRSGKKLDSSMARAFLEAMNLRQTYLCSENILNNTMYFATYSWLYEWLDKNGFAQINTDGWMKLDEFYRPVAWLEFDNASAVNFSFSLTATFEMAEDLRKILLAHICIDEAVVERTNFVEIIPGQGGLSMKSCTIDNPRVVHPEYYPYLDGGIEALFTDYIASPESVLIMVGPPGTGKTSGISAITDILSLLPIYAKKTEVVTNPGFVNYAFNLSDSYMDKVASSDAHRRSDLITEPYAKNQRRVDYGRIPIVKAESAVADDARIPMVIVEDAELLMAPRSSGNNAMQELLNETDGIGSNHTRKIVFTTNATNVDQIEEALMRAGRCYDVVHFRLLTPEEAIAARKAAGQPDFEERPTKDMSLADAMRPPRKRIVLSNGKAKLGFGSR